MKWLPRGALVTAGGLAACIVPGANRASSGAPGSETLTVWDGDVQADEFRLGWTRGAPPARHAQHWLHCSGDGCVSTLATGSYGHGASEGLDFHGEGSSWMGFGFAWAGWDRRQAPVDVSRYASLSFWLRAVTHSGSLGDLSVGIHGPDQGKEPGAVSLAAYGAGELGDGQWHRFVVPLSALSAQEPELNLRRVWDFGIGSMGTARSFDLYIDEIAFERPTP